MVGLGHDPVVFSLGVATPSPSVGRRPGAMPQRSEYAPLGGGRCGPISPENHRIQIEFQVPLRGGADDAAVVRRAVANVATRCDATVEVGDATLLADELVTNALRHAGGATAVLVGGASSWIRVEVTDSSPVSPVLREQVAHRDRGLGLLLVDRLASAWGTYPLPQGGKTVWFEVRSGPDAAS